MAYKNFEQHKKSDSVKWAIAFILIILLIGAVGGLSVGMWKLIKPADKSVAEASNTTWNFVYSANFPGGEFEAPEEFDLSDYVGKQLKAKVGDSEYVLFSQKNIPITADEILADCWFSGETFSHSDFWIARFVEGENAGKTFIGAASGLLVEIPLENANWLFSFRDEEMDQAYILAPNGFELSGYIGKDFSVMLDGEKVDLEYGNKFPLEGNAVANTSFWMQSEVGVGFVVLVDEMNDFVAPLFGDDVELCGKTLIIFPKNAVLTVTLPNTGVKA